MNTAAAVGVYRAGATGGLVAGWPVHLAREAGCRPKLALAFPLAVAAILAAVAEISDDLCMVTSVADEQPLLYPNGSAGDRVAPTAFDRWRRRQFRKSKGSRDG